jgi:hypothetical protein
MRAPTPDMLNVPEWLPVPVRSHVLLVEKLFAGLEIRSRYLAPALDRFEDALRLARARAPQGDGQSAG